MIVYRCDLCKKDIPEDHLFLRLFRLGPDATLWDICPSCVPILQQQLGDGRKSPQQQRR